MEHHTQNVQIQNEQTQNEHHLQNVQNAECTEEPHSHA